LWETGCSRLLTLNLEVTLSKASANGGNQVLEEKVQKGETELLKGEGENEKRGRKFLQAREREKWVLIERVQATFY